MRSFKDSLKEVLGGYSMRGSRRFDAPGNLRYGDYVVGNRGNVLSDSEHEAPKVRLTVRLLVQRPDKKILAVLDPNDSFYVTLPGGGIEPGETPEDAARRELWEETGLIANELVEVRTDEEAGFVTTLFRVKSAAGKIRGSEEGDVEWVEYSDLLDGKYGTYYNKIFRALGLL